MEDKVVPRLWNIKFDVRGIGKGCSVVKANKSNDAIKILLSNGFYNGTPDKYLVTSVEEIITPPCCELISEQIVEYFATEL